MNTAILNIKTDPETKARLKEFAAQLGLPVSALVNAQIKQILRSGRVELSAGETPTPYLQGLIKKAEGDYKADRNVHGPFDNADDMIADLEN
jgi:antitoxin component of RelBE/YafQ-DinJ toxin-antitoxin module